MIALLGAFVAGVLTTLAPCVLPLLPVIVGGSVAAVRPQADAPSAPARSAIALDVKRRTREARQGALVIALSLGVSIIAFTLALKASTALIGVPPQVWEWLSGVLLICLGLVSLFPQLWEWVSMRLQLQSRTAAGLGAARRQRGYIGQVLTGAALGPVFTSCSPLYGYVIVTVLPADVSFGLLLLLAYVAGLCGTLLLISLLGQRAVRGARWASDPGGWFRRGLGAVFVAIGVLVLTGWMKDIETWVLINSPIQPWNLDQGFIPGS
ncbi:MAG: cytochrome C biogenesis protein [Actinobacteria bacterium]|nr:cytochrome C biogenesis protein [Actinomycetota bacterium]